MLMIYAPLYDIVKAESQETEICSTMHASSNDTQMRQREDTNGNDTQLVSHQL